MQLLVLGAVQVDDPVNREFALVNGAGDIPWPPPFKDSVLAVCACCEGAVWVGPEQERTRAMAAETGMPAPVIMCLLCCCLTGVATEGSVVYLTSKEPGG